MAGRRVRELRRLRGAVREGCEHVQEWLGLPCAAVVSEVRDAAGATRAVEDLRTLVDMLGARTVRDLVLGRDRESTLSLLPWNRAAEVAFLLRARTIDELFEAAESIVPR